MSDSIDSSHPGTDRSVAIIGAGIAGLCTGIYAQMNGYAAHIYETHTKPGGLCTAWKRDGYTIDGCIHWFTGSRPGSSLYKLWHEIGLIQSLDLLDLDEFMRVEFPDAPTIVFHSDLDRMQRHLTEIAPEDAGFIAEFLNDAKRLSRHELPSDLPPRQLMGALTLLRIMPHMLRILGPLRKWNALTVAQFAERIKNPHLRLAFTQLWLPEMSAFALLVTLSWFHARQAGYPLGGSMPIVEAAEKRFLQLGGKIDYRARVADIIVEDDRATGVRLADGREETTDVVVSAADGHATVFDMLKGRYADDTVRGWFENLVPFPPLVFVGLGVGRAFSEEPKVANGSSLGLARPIKVGGQTIDRLSYHLHNFDPTLAPEGKTTITCMFATDYEYWKNLSQDRGRYEAEKKAIGDAVIEGLDGRFPGLAGLVEMVDVATPTTFERYTGNWRGSFEGWLPTPGSMTNSMRRTLPGLQDFYMAGQWVAPGGGLPSGVMTGREVVQLMCHQDGKKFRVPAS